MADDMAPAAMFEYYERGGERDRLDEPAGQLESARTRQIIARHLPPPPATVADIGGGPGRYSLWLAALGYRVLHRDVVPLHVDQLRRQAAGNPWIDSAVADARDPGLDPGSADAVLLTRAGAAQSLLPESATQAVCVIIAWLAGWTIPGAWRMTTRDAWETPCPPILLRSHQRCPSKQSGPTSRQYPELVPLRTELKDLRAGAGAATTDLGNQSRHSACL